DDEGQDRVRLAAAGTGAAADRRGRGRRRRRADEEAEEATGGDSVDAGAPEEAGRRREQRGGGCGGVDARSGVPGADGGGRGSDRGHRGRSRDLASPATPGRRKPRRTHKRRVAEGARRVFDYPRDPVTGGPALPLQLGSITTVISLGRIPDDPEGFHNDRYIWPVGYKIVRYFASMYARWHDSSRPVGVFLVQRLTLLSGRFVVYPVCSIEEDHVNGGPLFSIEAEDNLNAPPVVAATASGVWSLVLKESNAVRRKAGFNSVSGPEYYGLSQAV
ncbi:MAG: hypothetical protein BJ554DRAFT_4016, partial [Olpidium bornovanus]